MEAIAIVVYFDSLTNPIAEIAAAMKKLKCAAFFPRLRLRFFREARGEVELKELNIEPLET